MTFFNLIIHSQTSMLDTCRNLSTSCFLSFRILQTFGDKQTIRNSKRNARLLRLGIQSVLDISSSKFISNFRNLEVIFLVPENLL